MYKRIELIVASLCVFTILGWLPFKSAPTSAATPVSGATPSSRFGQDEVAVIAGKGTTSLESLRFAEPIDLATALQTLDQAGVRVAMLEHRVEANGQIFVGGMAIRAGGSYLSVSKAYKQAHRDYLRDISRSILDQELAPTEQREMRDTLRAYERVLENPLEVTGALVAIDPSSNADQRLLAIPMIRSLERVGQDNNSCDERPELLESPSGTRPANAQAQRIQGLDQNPWWPNTGSITTAQAPNWDGGEAYRYVFQRFKWTSSQRLTTLKSLEGGCPAYESDAVYYNYDGKQFLGKQIQYWSANYPYAYLDTQKFDSADEPGYTVGFHDVSALSTNVNYSTYIRTNLGNSGSDTGKVNGQELPKTHCGCAHPWCIGLIGGSSEPLLPAWNHGVPGTTHWTH